jgi:hypothetical protein
MADGLAIVGTASELPSGIQLDFQKTWLTAMAVANFNYW